MVAASEKVKIIYGTKEDSSFIIRYFEDFYSELSRWRARVLHIDPITGEPLKPVEDDYHALAEGDRIRDENEAPPEEVFKALKSLLSSQASDAARYGGEFAAKYYREAEFVMVALADELLLHASWPGKKWWEQNHLESQLYGTHMAGETFFKKLDDFLHVRDPSRADIAMLYLLALGLGFKGKYRGIDDHGQLARYRRELFIFINHRDPTLFKLGNKMFPESYLHTLEEEKVVYLQDYRPWLGAFAGVLTLMLLISYGVWHITTNDVRTSMKNIIEAVEQENITN